MVDFPESPVWLPEGHPGTVSPCCSWRRATHSLGEVRLRGWLCRWISSQASKRQQVSPNKHNCSGPKFFWEKNSIQIRSQCWNKALFGWALQTLNPRCGTLTVEAITAGLSTGPGVEPLQLEQAVPGTMATFVNKMMVVCFLDLFLGNGPSQPSQLSKIKPTEERHR